MHAPAPAAPDHPVLDKRRTILAAALRLIARSGLHNTPMSALAREAGVAAGTLYLYFPSKAAMINALYLELLEDRTRAATAHTELPEKAAAAPHELFWRSWHGLARWDLDHPDASNVIRQCRASGILTTETRTTERRFAAADFAQFDAAVARGLLRPVEPQVCHALFAGPIAALVQMREAGEFEVDDAVLRATFDGVCRSLLATSSVPEG